MEDRFSALQYTGRGNPLTSPGTGDTAVLTMGSTGAASAFSVPESLGGVGTMASQAASRGSPRAPKTKKRPRHPSIASSRGDRKRPTRLPAGFVPFSEPHVQPSTCIAQNFEARLLDTVHICRQPSTTTSGTFVCLSVSTSCTTICSS